MKTATHFIGFMFVALGVAGCAVEVDSRAQGDEEDDALLDDRPGAEEPGLTPSAPAPDKCGVCIRVIQCVSECDGPIVQSGCCACPDGTVEMATCTSTY